MADKVKPYCPRLEGLVPGLSEPMLAGYWILKL
jgi:hypothetical protein